MNEFEKLVAVEQIKKVMAKRVRAMDTKNWGEYDTCHTDDATSNSYGEVPAEFKPAGGIAQGKGAILAMIRKIVDGNVKITSVHHAHAPEIEITSATTARGVWALEDHFWWQNVHNEEHFHGYGHYHETYECVGGEWLIKSRIVTRLRVDHTPNYFSYYNR
jgi:hypothetical protein